MPLPFLAVAAGAATGLVTAPLFTVEQSYLGPAIAPGTRGRTYDANTSNPNIAPGLSEILRLYYCGELTFGEMRDYAKWSGIGVGGGQGFYFGRTWNNWVNANRPRPSIDLALRANALGSLDDDKLDDVIRFNGFRFREDRGLLKLDTVPMSPTDIIGAYWRQDIDLSTANKYLKHAGVRLPAFRQMYFDQRIGLDVQTILLLLNKGIIDHVTATKYLGWIGFRDVEVQDGILRGRWKPVDISAGIAMSNMRVFDEARALQLGLDGDKPDNWETIARMSGLRYNGIGDQTDDSQVEFPTWADYAWRAHWNTLDPLSAIEMLRRLRPTGGTNGGPRDSGGEVFTEADFYNVLQTNAIAPGYRSKLRAISYQVPQRLIVKRLYDSGVWTRSQVKESIQDNGYTEENAEDLTKMIEWERRKSQADRLRSPSIASIKEAYRVGTITRDQAAANLYSIYLDDPDRQEAFFGTLPGDQASVAMGNPQVAIAINSIDSDIQAELNRAAIEVIHKAYMRAELTAANAIGGLTTLGIVSSRAVSYVQLWSYELAAEGVEIKAGQLVAWYLDNLIDASTLTQRLLLLHYSPVDAQLILASANLKLSERQQKIAAAQDALKQREAKGLAATARALQQQQQALAKQLCKSGSRAQLAKWAAIKLITVPDAYDRLIKCGMSEDDSIALLATAQKLEGDHGKQEIKSQLAGKSTPTIAAKPSAGAKSTHASVASAATT